MTKYHIIILMQYPFVLQGVPIGIRKKVGAEKLNCQKVKLKYFGSSHGTKGDADMSDPSYFLFKMIKNQIMKRPGQLK